MGSLINILLFFCVLIVLGLVWFTLVVVIKDNSGQECDASNWRDKENE